MTSNKLYLAAGHLFEWCAGLCAEMDKKITMALGLLAFQYTVCICFFVLFCSFFAFF